MTPESPFQGDMKAYRVPGYSFFLACVFFAFGKSLVAVRILQCCTGAATALFAWGIGDTISRRVAWFAGVAVACHPDLVVSSSGILAESIHTTLLAGAVLLLLRGGRCLPANVVAGVVWGAATMVKSQALTMLPFVWLWAFLRHPFRTALARSIAATLGFALVVGPWIARNAATIGLPTLSSDSGRVFWESNNVHNRSGQGVAGLLDFSPYQHLDEAGQSRAAAAEGSKFLRSLPLKDLLVFEARKVGGFFYPFREKYDVVFGMLFPLWMLGCLLGAARRDGPGLLLLGIFLSYFVGILAVTGNPRFREPLLPLALVQAGVAIAWLLDSFRARRNVLLYSAWTALQIGIYLATDPIRAMIRRLLL